MMLVHARLNPVGNAKPERLLILLILEQGAEHIYIFRRRDLDIAPVARHHMRSHALASDNRARIDHVFIALRPFAHFIVRRNNIFPVKALWCLRRRAFT